MSPEEADAYLAEMEYRREVLEERRHRERVEREERR